MTPLQTIVAFLSKLLALHFRGSVTLHFNGDGAIPKIEVTAAGRPEEVAKLFLT